MALPCETYLDSNGNSYTSVPDCCYWDTPCYGCPWLLSGRPGITTQCLTRQFQPTSIVTSAVCATCSPGYSTSTTSKICCWTSDAFDVNTYCSTVSPCICSAFQTHAFFNPMLTPPSSTSISPLQCVNSCKTYFGDGYYQLAGDTCVVPAAFEQACPTALSNSLNKKGTQRTLIKDGVCDIALNLVSVNGSTLIAADLNNSAANEIDANKTYKLASFMVWVGLGLLLLGFWGNRAYLVSKLPSIS